MLISTTLLKFYLRKKKVSIAKYALATTWPSTLFVYSSTTEEFSEDKDIGNQSIRAINAKGKNLVNVTVSWSGIFRIQHFCFTKNSGTLTNKSRSEGSEEGVSEYDPGHRHDTQPMKASDRRVGRPGRPQLLQIVIEREAPPESHAATYNTLRNKMNKGRKKI